MGKKNLWFEVARERVQQLGLTYRQVASHVGVGTPGAIGHWFSGRSNPDPDQLVKLAKLLRLPLDRLLSGEGFVIDPLLLAQCADAAERLRPAKEVRWRVIALIYQQCVERAESPGRVVEQQLLIRAESTSGKTRKQQVQGTH